MKAKDLDKIFDDGDVDFTEHLDLSKAFKPGQEQKRVNVDFPVWMLERIDKEAGRLGVPRQSLIKVWIGEKLENRKSRRQAKKVLQKG
jgi:predicted DNA binding CopG/RHH family protein